MLSGISQAIPSMGQYIPSTEQVAQKFTTNLPTIAKNLSKVALPALALIALSNMATAEAGPIAYVTCMASCPINPCCSVTCLPLLFAPGP